MRVYCVFLWEKNIDSPRLKSNLATSNLNSNLTSCAFLVPPILWDISKYDVVFRNILYHFKWPFGFVSCYVVMFQFITKYSDIWRHVSSYFLLWCFLKFLVYSNHMGVYCVVWWEKSIDSPHLKSNLPTSN